MSSVMEVWLVSTFFLRQGDQESRNRNLSFTRKKKKKKDLSLAAALSFLARKGAFPALHDSVGVLLPPVTSLKEAPLAQTSSRFASALSHMLLFLCSFNNL